MAENHRVRDGMLVLTVFGSLLMLPPLVNVFNQSITHFGIPQIVFYLFAVWMLLVVGTALLVRAMPRDEPDGDDR